MSIIMFIITAICIIYIIMLNICVIAIIIITIKCFFTGLFRAPSARPLFPAEAARLASL